MISKLKKYETTILSKNSSPTGLEISVTNGDTPCINKGIQYRIHPDTIDTLTAAKIDVCALANNHILDWGGVKGLYESLETLHKANIYIYNSLFIRINFKIQPPYQSGVDHTKILVNT